MPLPIVAVAKLFGLIGSGLKGLFLKGSGQLIAQPAVQQSAAPALPEVAQQSKPWSHRVGTARLANFYREMANTQRIEGTAATAYRAIKQHNFEKVQQADAMAMGALNGFGQKSAKGATAQPTSAAFGATGDDAMDLRVESPTNHYHYYPQPSAPAPAPGLSALGKFLLAAGLVAAGLFGPAIWAKLMRPPTVNVEVPAQTQTPQSGYGLQFGTPQTSTSQ
jgi:hypothetical protein